VSLHRTAIEAAVTAGVGRVLYTSHQGAALTSPFGPGRDHAATEQVLADSGLAWTSLRNGSYAHSLTWLAGPWRETGVISVPADGPVSWTSREDEAEAAAVILASGGAYDGPTTLTAGEAVTFHDVALIASELTGRPITCEVIDPEVWIAAQIAAGRPEFSAASPWACTWPPTRDTSLGPTPCSPHSCSASRAACATHFFEHPATQRSDPGLRCCGLRHEDHHIPGPRACRWSPR